MNNICLSNNNTVVYSQENDISLTINPHVSSDVILHQFEGKTILIHALEDSNISILYFSKKEEQVSFELTLERNANVHFNMVLMNDEMKDNVLARVQGEGAELSINTLSLAKKCLKELNIDVIHLAPETKSTVTNYGISFEEGKNHFNVVGEIKGQMKHSDVRQITKGLILSPTGECLAKPILLIDYFDVKAYHGATIGKISDDDLFYLMSRGLTKDAAFMLVINGLLEPFVKDIQNEDVKNEIMERYQSYFVGE